MPCHIVLWLIYTPPAAIIFFRKCFLYCPMLPSHRVTVLFSQTIMSFAILSSNLQHVSTDYFARNVFDKANLKS
jgi:hypothetical protein